jgi:hypothetical protein
MLRALFCGHRFKDGVFTPAQDTPFRVSDFSSGPKQEAVKTWIKNMTLARIMMMYGDQAAEAVKEYRKTTIEERVAIRLMYGEDVVALTRWYSSKC